MKNSELKSLTSFKERGYFTLKTSFRVIVLFWGLNASIKGIRIKSVLKTRISDRGLGVEVFAHKKIETGSKRNHLSFESQKKLRFKITKRKIISTNKPNVCYHIP